MMSRIDGVRGVGGSFELWFLRMASSEGAVLALRILGKTVSCECEHADLNEAS